jgi:hypothetical protein
MPGGVAGVPPTTEAPYADVRPAWAHTGGDGVRSCNTTFQGFGLSRLQEDGVKEDGVRSCNTTFQDPVP